MGDIVEETAFDVFTELSHPELADSGMSAGTTGSGDMDSWSSDDQIISNLLIGNFTNASSYPIPSAVVEGSSFDNFNESTHGIFVDMRAEDPSGDPMTGTASIKAGDQNLISKTVSGSFILSGPPMPGVVLGGSVSRAAISFQFTPSIPGIAFTEYDFSGKADLGTVQYGEINGKVTDYYGKPVQGVTVAATGLSDVTDVSGNYRMAAPGGTEVPIASLGGNYTFSLTPEGGESITQDIQFPMLKISVKDGDYKPIENAPVDINGTRMYTNEFGEVEMPKAEIGAYDILVMEDFRAEDFAVSDQGQLYSLEVSPGSSFGSYGEVESGSVTIDIVDAENGEPVSDVEAVLLGDDRISLSNRDGTVKLLSDNVGDSAIVGVAQNDKRYETEVIEVEIPNSGSGYKELALSRGSSNPTY